MIDKELFIKKWRNICLSYYIDEDNDIEYINKQEILAAFDSLAPSNGGGNFNNMRHKSFTINISIDDITLNIRENDCSLNRLIDYLGADIPAIIRNDESLWYELNDVKNQARSDSHKKNIGKRKRSFLLLASKTSSSMNEMLEREGIYNLSSRKLQDLLSISRKNPSLSRSIIGGLYSFLCNQLVESSVCLKWALSIDILFERDLSTQISALEVFLSLGSLQESSSDEIIILFHPQLSDFYIRRIIRTIERCFRQNQLSNQDISKLRNDQEHSRFELSSTKRLDPPGQREDLLTHLANYVLPCPLL